MKQRLDTYDELPRDMKRYLAHNGWHFNKKACEHAVKFMRRMNEATGKMERVEYIDKEKTEEKLKANNITLKHLTGYDHVFVANMAKADFWGSSIADEQHLAKYIKDVVDDADQADGYIFNRWLADMCINGNPIPWEDLV